MLNQRKRQLAYR